VPKSFGTTLSIVLGALLAINVALSFRQQRELRRVRHDLRKAQEQLAARRFVPGDLLDRFEVVDASGATRTLSARESARLTIVVMHPACDSCAATARELRHARPTRAPLLISLGNRDETERFGRQHGLREIYTLAPTNFPIVRQKFSAIPQAVLVERGMVTRACDSVSACL
jgi:hypothetical protein